MTDHPGSRVKRNGTADLLKGLAVLFMIQVHIMEQFVTPDAYNSIIGKIALFLGGPPCAPVFLGVMGYFLACSEKPFAYFLKRGAILFIGGLLLNIARSANLLFQIIQGKADLDPWFFIMGADILTLAGISLILTGFLRMIFRNSALCYCLTAIVVAAISPWMNQFWPTGKVPSHLLAFIWGTAAWSYFPVFPWFGYVLAGYAFKLFTRQTVIMNKINVQDQFIYFIPLWIGVIITLPYASGITQNLEGEGGYYHHGILFFSWVILFMISYMALVHLIETSYGNHLAAKIIRWTGQKVTSLYIIQWLIIGNLATWLFRSQDLMQYFAWFVVVTLVTLVTGKLVEKVRTGQRV